MDLFHGLLLITSIHLLAAASPGPDFVLVSQQTLTHGKKAGLLCSVGIALGLAIHILYSSLGLAAVIANSATALWVIKILGGGYLIYLGFQGLKAKASVQERSSTATDIKAGPDSNSVRSRSAAKTVGMGFLCNALNPKAPVYFVALFTLVLSPQMPLYQLAVYGLWMMVLQLFWFSAVVLLLSRPAINRSFKRLGHWIDRLLGGAMVALGLKLLLTRAS